MTTIDNCFSDKSILSKPFYLLCTIIAVVCIFLLAEVSAKSSSDSLSQDAFKLLPASEYPVFNDDLDFGYLEQAIAGSISYYQKLSSEKQFYFGNDAFTPDTLIRSLNRFAAFIEKKPAEKELNEFIHRHYQIYTYMNGGSTKGVLFTGYYEPLLHGSLKQTAEYRYPLYSRPADLVQYNPRHSPEKTEIGRGKGNTIVPYYTRQQIEERGISGINASPIAWVNDPVSLFFLHIQGSGKIRLENGRMINVHYNISNGHPYKSIGKYLIDHKKLSKETVSMQSIREYLNAHPDEVETIFNYNPRYIFFEIVEKGPVGCFNIEVTPGRSLALDRRTAPAGALVFIQGKKPEMNKDGKISKWIRFSRFMLNQDTGSAIKGPGRADIFWGNGPYAELAAGYMKHPGNLYYLVLKSGCSPGE